MNILTFEESELWNGNAMNILAIDTTGTPCSVAVLRNGSIVSEQYINLKKTHSQVLMSLIAETLYRADMPVAEVDVFAVVAGPGSFTGVRIGVCTAKGMAQSMGKPIAALNTLDVLAGGVSFYDGVVCPMLDARREQVYSAIYKDNVRITDYMATDISEVLALLPEGKVMFLGDGAVAYEHILREHPGASMAPSHLMFQRATVAAEMAANMVDSDMLITAELLSPFYVRKSSYKKLDCQP